MKIFSKTTVTLKLILKTNKEFIRISDFKEFLIVHRKIKKVNKKKMKNINF